MSAHRCVVLYNDEQSLASFQVLSSLSIFPIERKIQNTIISNFLAAYIQDEVLQI